MKTFVNTEFTKEQAVDLAKRHQEADAFKQRTYGEYCEKTGLWNGCSVGCMAKGRNHSGYETLFGIDRRIAYLTDRIFENLKQGEHKNFTLNLFDAIPENIDSKIIYYRFMHWLLVDAESGVIRFSKNKSIIEDVASLYQRAIDGDYSSDEDWEKARKSAYAAAYATYTTDAAAYAAADAAYAAYATYTTDAAAYAAAYAAYAADAAAAAAAADAADAARTKHYQVMRDKLIQLFKEAK